MYTTVIYLYFLICKKLIWIHTCVVGVCMHVCCMYCMHVYFLTMAGVVVALYRALCWAQTFKVLLQWLQLLSQTGPVWRKQVILLHNFTDPFQQLSHTEKCEEKKRVKLQMRRVKIKRRLEQIIKQEITPPKKAILDQCDQNWSILITH